MSAYEIVLKRVEPVLVASVRGVIPSYPEQGHLWDRLERALQQQGVHPSGACFTVYHQDEPEIDAEVCEPLPGPFSAHVPVQVHMLPAAETMAATLHHGPFTTLGEAYAALLNWVEGNGYRICGPGRELYLKPPATPGNQSDPETLTEIQFPVTRA